MARPHRSIDHGIVKRSLFLPLGIVALYLAFFFALLTPFFQRHFIFLHSIRFPFFADFSRPSRYGLAPFKARNIQLTTHDQEKIGAWHILPEPFYQAHIAERHQQSIQSAEEAVAHIDDEVYAQALREYPTILYLHGNAMSRAAPFRIGAYTSLTGRIDANVVAIDYRGFGDSSGSPSEDGLVEDAHAAYRWILSHHRPTEQSTPTPPITVFGQSLGTGIAALLAAKLESLGSPVDNVVLMAPYANLRLLVKDYRLGGMIPVLAPLRGLPFHDYLLTKFMKTHLNTLKALPRLFTHRAIPDGPASDPTQTAPSRRGTRVVLLHAADDPIIPVTHSRRLFTALTKHCQPETIQKRNIDGFAEMRRFTCDDHNGIEKQVTLIETQFGGHNHLTEGALDLVALACDLPSAFVKRNVS
ncbi:alpha/beta-hydrolase [Testicularia cyperi]|uniref:Alpha/beta-hydrolase n=1 Tax=Testicularia cyperi TaxID=1882483 RepID=A0A317XMD1_9BASI|nr:alpha/beta-hydrolase [Testicularia cyperi]